jgi:L,D-transpeptidase ErfK/SrfK
MSMLVYPKRILCLLVMAMFCVTTVYAEIKDIVSPSIVINLPSRMLELYSGNTFIKEYPVAVGKPSTPTPIGQFKIMDMEKNPTWVPFGRDYVVVSGPNNPLGYRWMSFFELYGVHGTNEPGSIGQVVSNGCIRMQEENVDELFEVVGKGTPVRVTYERVKVKVDSEGLVTIRIYPDIYGIKTLGLREVANKLGEVGLKGFVSEAFLLKVMREETGQQVILAKVHNLKVNGKLLKERALSIDNVRYMPVWAIAKELGSDITWNEKTQMVWKDKQSTHGVLKGDIIYINEQSIKELFDGELFFTDIENCLEFNGY